MPSCCQRGSLYFFVFHSLSVFSFQFKNAKRFCFTFLFFCCCCCCCIKMVFHLEIYIEYEFNTSHHITHSTQCIVNFKLVAIVRCVMNTTKKREKNGAHNNHSDWIDAACLCLQLIHWKTVVNGHGLLRQITLFQWCWHLSPISHFALCTHFCYSFYTIR